MKKHTSFPSSRARCSAPLLLAALACGAAGEAGSEEAQAEVVIRATPLRESALETAQPITVLDGTELVRRRALSIGETLASQPGISGSYFGPQASRPVIRGLGGERVQMYEDGGESLDVAALSADHAVTIDPLIASRIEVVRGPATLLFGNGAAGGVVNVVTDRIPERPFDEPVLGAFELRGNTATEERAAAAHVHGGTRAWTWHADGFARRTGDLSIPGTALSRRLRAALAAAGEEPDDAHGTLENSASESAGGALGTSLVGEWGFAGVSVSRFESDYGVPGHAGHEHEEDEADGGVTIAMEQTRYDLRSQLRDPLRGFTALRLHATRAEYAHREREPGGTLGTQFRQDGLDGRLVLDHAPLAGWRGTLGVQLRRAELEALGDEAFVPPSDTRNTGIFVHEERPIGPVTLELGARLEHQRIAPGAGTALPRYDAEAVSGSAGVLWKLGPEYAIAFNVTSTQRHPTATELYADGPHLASRRYETGDPALHRERATTFDLGLRKVAGAWRMSLTAFRSDYSRYIFAAPTSLERDGLPVVQYVQADARFTGFEAELELPVAETPAGALATRLVADYVRARLEDGSALPQIPPLRGGLELALERARFAATLSVMRHDAQRRVAANELPTDGYTMADLDLSWRFPAGEREVLLFLRGENLLDEDARRHSSPLKDFAPLPGRALAGGVRVRF